MFEQLIWAVPLAVLAAGLWRPKAGLLVLAACLPLFGSPPGGPYLAALDVAALAAIATSWRAGRPPPSRFDWPVAAFLVVSVASLLPLAYQPPSWNPKVMLGLLRVFPDVQSWTILYTWRALANLLLGWGLYRSVRRVFAGESLRPLGLALAVGLVPLLGLGLAEHAGLIDLGSYRAIGGEVWQTRLHSLFFHSGWLAEYLVLAVPVAAAALLGWRRRGRLLAILLVAVALVTLLFTEQRGGWLTAAAQLGVLAAVGLPWLVRHRQQLRLAVVAGLLAVVLASAVVILRPSALSPVVERVKTAVTDLSGRANLWKTSVELAGERPLLGWGLGSFSPVHDRKDHGKWPPPRPFWLTAHNLYLMMAVERGLLGLAALGLLIWGGVVSIRRGFANGRSDERHLIIGLALSFGGFLIYGIVQYLFYLKNTEFLIWILLGMLASVAPSEQPSSRPLVRSAQILCVAALLLIPWRLLAVDLPMLRGDRRYGFHVPEGRKPDVYLWIEDIAARRLPWEGETLVIWLANGHPRPGDHPVQVTIRLDDRVIGEIAVGGRWKRHDFQVGAPQKKWLLLTIEAEPTFRPFREFRKYPELESSTDIRHLGVAFRWLHWKEEEPATTEDDASR
ncbi:MAG: O-antigen ligase family protein [Thermoanaerobaculia bacterium]